MSTKRHITSLSASIILLAIVTVGCKSYPSTYPTRQYFRKNYVPGKHALENSDYPVPCYTPEFYGYHGTCWRTWPENWVPCPEELVEEQVIEADDKPTVEVERPERTAPPEVDPTVETPPIPQAPTRQTPKVSNPIPGNPPKPDPPAQPNGSAPDGASLRRLGPAPQIVPIAPPVADSVPAPARPQPQQRQQALPLPPQAPPLRSPQRTTERRPAKAPARVTRSDLEVAREIARALQQLKGEGKLKDFRVDLNVSQGVAEFRGFVSNRQQHELISRVANRIDGVTGVQNMLRISPPAKAPEISETARKVLPTRRPDNSRKPESVLPNVSEVIEATPVPKRETRPASRMVLRLPRREPMSSGPRRIAPLPEMLNMNVVTRHARPAETKSEPARQTPVLKTVLTAHRAKPTRAATAPMPENLDLLIRRPEPKKSIPVRKVAAKAPEVVPTVRAEQIPIRKLPAKQTKPVRVRFNDVPKAEAETGDIPVVKSEAITR